MPLDTISIDRLAYIYIHYISQCVCMRVHMRTLVHACVSVYEQLMNTCTYM